MFRFFRIRMQGDIFSFTTGAAKASWLQHSNILTISFLYLMCCSIQSPLTYADSVIRLRPCISAGTGICIKLRIVGATSASTPPSAIVACVGPT